MSFAATLNAAAAGSGFMLDEEDAEVLGYFTEKPKDVPTFLHKEMLKEAERRVKRAYMESAGLPFFLSFFLSAAKLVKWMSENMGTILSILSVVLPLFI